MFPEKKRSWIEDTSLSNFPYYSWEDWRTYAPDNFLWKDYYPLMWNIRETEKGFQIQVLYLRSGRKFDVMNATVLVKPTDEPAIRDWLAQIVWAHQR